MLGHEREKNARRHRGWLDHGRDLSCVTGRNRTRWFSCAESKDFLDADSQALAAIGLVGVIIFANKGPVVSGPGGPSTALVAVTHDIAAGSTIQNADWQSITSSLPPATANLYFTPTQRSLFLGKTLVRPLHSGDLLAKDGDLLAAANASYSVVPITFKVAPGGLASGDSLCIYAISAPGALRIFYLTPLVVNTSAKGWQVTVPPSKAPYFLYAAVNLDLVAFGSTSSGVCPSTPIFSSTQAIEGATGTTGTGG